MHDRTRLRICRAAFLLLCLLPTSATVAWIGVCHSPVNEAVERAGWEQWLAEQSGLRVSIARISHPAQGITRLDGLSLADRETGEPIARVRQVEIGGETAAGDGAMLIAVSQPEIHSRQLQRLWEILHQRMLRGEVDLPQPLELTAAELTVLPADDEIATTLTDFRCRVEPDLAGPKATIEFFDAAMPAEKAVQLQIVRDRQTSPPTTRWELDTRGAAIWCSLLSDDIESLGSLGVTATFSGSAWATLGFDGWEGEIHGRFQQVDLDRVVSDRFPHKLSGMAEVTLQRAKFRGGRIIDVAGSLRATGGSISLSLLEQAEKSLGLQLDPQTRLSDRTLRRYRQLACDFTIGGNGLEIAGRCDGPQAGVVLTDDRRPLLANAQPEILPAVALVRTLSPDSAVQVPATLETDVLLRALPIPAVSAPATADDPRRRIFSPLRLR